MTFRRGIGLLFCSLLLVCAAPAAAFAQGTAPAAALAQDADEGTSTWDGSSVATAYESGDGSEASPYEIASASQFAYFANQINAGEGTEAHYVLSRDLDLSAVSWEPITGSYDDYLSGWLFQGNFDGRGHCITYKIEGPEYPDPYAAFGLFGFAEGGISNLAVDGSISGIKSLQASWVGGICGIFAGDLDACASDVDISIQQGVMSNVATFGGVVGEFQAGSMQRCRCTGAIDLSFSLGYSDSHIGGICGNVFDGTVRSCKNEGSVTVGAPAGEADGWSAGGIAGRAYTAGEAVTSIITDCLNTGTITSKQENGGHVGGVVGELSAVLQVSGAASSKVMNSYSSGSVSGGESSGAVAGLLNQFNYSDEGSATAEVVNCFYAVGKDENATLVTDPAELYDKLSEVSGEGVWLLDANGEVRLRSEFTVNAMPQAVFTATGENGGTLSGVSESMKYSVDGGTTWNAIPAATMEITGVTAANGVRVYHPGDMLSTLDSDVQVITVTQAQVPKVEAVACTTSLQNDGKITGVDDTMEYKSSGSDAWKGVVGGTVMGLANGSYDVRVKASGTTLASPAATVAVEKHVCVARGGWSTDDDGHWNTCACGAVLNKVSHAFEWVVDSEPTATEAGAKHEECEVCGYKKAAVEIPALGEKPGKDGSAAPGGDDGNKLAQTGDASLLGVAATGIAGVAAVAAGTVVTLKRRNK